MEGVNQPVSAKYARVNLCFGWRSQNSYLYVRFNAQFADKGL